MGGYGTPPGYGTGYPGGPYGGHGYGAPPTKTNGLAVASLVCSAVLFFTCGVGSIIGVILGHISLGQIKRDGTGGRGLAIAGLVIGYILIALWGLIWVLTIVGKNSSN